MEHSNLMRFHLVGLPFESSVACAYEAKIKKWAPMMRALGHTVIVYGPQHYGGVVCGYEGPREFTIGAPHWEALNTEAAAAISERAEPHDFLLLSAGLAHKTVADALPHLLAVEPFVGYGGTFTNLCVYESRAWQHTVYGAKTGGDPHQADGRFYDTVIPNYYDPAEFPEGKYGGDYFLFMGRLIDRKGFHIAADVCERLGARLIIAGEGEPPSYGEYVGVVDHHKRAELMGGAIATFVPTQYVEPFGGVAAESMLCGTPVLVTPWGGFTDYVRHGLDGFWCHTLREFMEAADMADALSRREIRRHAQGLFSTAVVGPQFERYFTRLLSLHGEGWYATPPAMSVLT